jgi:hypothetical protein
MKNVKFINTNEKPKLKAPIMNVKSEASVYGGYSWHK